MALLAPTGCSKKDAARATPELKVAAAADLAFAFKDVGAAYTKKTGQAVSFSFGSTGLLAKQISEGAPFDVFAAANVSFADDAIKSGACTADSKALYAIGRIVMWTKKGTEPPKTVQDLADAAETDLHTGHFRMLLQTRGDDECSGDWSLPPHHRV
jgi:molybdate transport system substrate-binding protein